MDCGDKWAEKIYDLSPEESKEAMNKGVKGI